MAIGIGVEIGPSAVRAVVLERVASSPGRATPPAKLVAERDVSCDTSNPTALTQALSQLRQSLHIAQPIALGLPSGSAILATVQPLIASQRRAILAVQFELQQLLPFQLADVAWHYSWLSTVNGHGLAGRARSQLPNTPPEAVVAAMRRSLLEERLACCRRAGVSVRAVAITSLAALNAWYAQAAGASSTPTLLLNVMDERMAEWIVSTPRSLHVLPVTLAAAQPIVEALIASYQVVRTQFSELSFGAMWLLGLASVELQGSLATQIGLSVERFDVARIAANASAGSQQPAHNAVALGLALQELGLARIPLNLLAYTQREHHARQMQRGALMAGGLCAVAAIGFGVSGMMELSHRRAAILQVLERRERLYQTLRPEVRAFLQRQERIERRSLQLERLVTDGSLVTQTLGQIADALPETVWLTKIDCTRNGAVEGVLEGRAKSFQDVTQLLDRLKTVAGMTSVKPISTSVTKEATAKEDTPGKELIAFTVQVQRQLAPSAAATAEPAPRDATAAQPRGSSPRPGATPPAPTAPTSPTPKSRTGSAKRHD